MEGSAQRPTPLVLLVLDGFGIAPPDSGNAVVAAATPVLDQLLATYPSMTLRASGEAVGLSWGEMGNSEVGHLTIGAGRVYYQSLPRIN
ncbi:2,3-bisphosphoglycerate-independent phosphoglycerate mutase, partial [Candidatus Uhrbacteria bacterium]|nr:2,3-bisphosphoglycerate-independent phosphoglycerate mutase [Candidatus Uhrbacteria bacterium]